MFIWIVFIGIAVISYLVQSDLQSKFEKYSQIPLSNGMTGREVAEKMLRDNGIYDVRVVSTGGMLTDHYNPANKTVNLSEGVFNTCSVAAAAVAAHECGHAVQHARAYAPPADAFGAGSGGSVFFVHHVVDSACRHSDGQLVPPQLLFIGICLFAMTTLFSFITLPVEIDASRRALAWLSNAGVTSSYNHGQAKDALKSAAYTYVVAALGSLATLIYYITIFTNRRE